MGHNCLQHCVKLAQHGCAASSSNAVLFGSVGSVDRQQALWLLQQTSACRTAGMMQALKQLQIRCCPPHLPSMSPGLPA